MIICSSIAHWFNDFISVFCALFLLTGFFGRLCDFILPVKFPFQQFGFLVGWSIQVKIWFNFSIFRKYNCVTHKNDLKINKKKWPFANAQRILYQEFNRELLCCMWRMKKKRGRKKPNNFEIKTISICVFHLLKTS